eukprot:1019520-Heterocapsa_arctica.AAC.1
MPRITFKSIRTALINLDLTTRTALGYKTISVCNYDNTFQQYAQELERQLDTSHDDSDTFSDTSDDQPDDKDTHGKHQKGTSDPPNLEGQVEQPPTSQEDKDTTSDSSSDQDDSSDDDKELDTGIKPSDNGDDDGGGCSRTSTAHEDGATSEGGGKQEGTIKFFRIMDGWGYITGGRDKPDIWFHITECKDNRVPQLGDILKYDTRPRQEEDWAAGGHQHHRRHGTRTATMGRIQCGQGAWRRPRSLGRRQRNKRRAGEW